MRFKTILFISFAFFLIKSKAQIEELNPELSKQWLVSIENDTISAGDYWYVYNKNADPKKVVTKVSLLNYRKLYDKYHLAVSYL